MVKKKIGKNNPKAHEIESDNQKRQEWNRAVDMALISGVPEPKIMEVKRKEITEPIRESIARRGNRPRLFSRVVTVAVEALEFLIASVLFKKPREVPEQTSVAQTERTETEHQEHIAENSMAAVKVTKDVIDTNGLSKTKELIDYTDAFYTLGIIIFITGIIVLAVKYAIKTKDSE